MPLFRVYSRPLCRNARARAFRALRQIVKNAGVTAGAFYGYFSSNETLLNALVELHAVALRREFMEARSSFADLPEEEQAPRDVEQFRNFHASGWVNLMGG